MEMERVTSGCAWRNTPSTSSFVWVNGGLMPEWGVELCFECVRAIWTIRLWKEREKCSCNVDQSFMKRARSML